MSESKVTTNHDEIRKWVEQRNGKPACVRGTGGKNDVGMLRINFPGYSGEETLEEISWDEFFDKFDDNNLAMVYQEKTTDGTTSRFSKLVDRSDADGGRSNHSKRG